MSTVTAVVTYTAVSPPPAVQTFDHYAVTVTDSAGVAQTDRYTDPSDPAPIQFTITAPGDATGVIQAFDTANQPMGSPISGTFTIPAVTTFQQPATLTFSVA